MSILIKNVLLEGKTQDILVEGNRIREIGEGIKEKADHRIDGRKKAAIPGFVNTHTHAAMTLFRSYADDIALHDWLNNHIWPREAKMTPKDVYTGTRLACLEMIKTGTTSFNDHYWHMSAAAKAASDSGLRAVICPVFIDLGDKEKEDAAKKETIKVVKEIKSMNNPLIKPAVGPHAPYTVSPENLAWCKEYADKEGLLVHIHIAETKKEMEDYKKAHKKELIPFLEEIGFLGSNVVSAHSVHLNKKDLAMLAKHDVKISHNPISNMKLASGIMPYDDMKEAGLTLSLGTDGCASNNNLDMFDSMKFAALLQKVNKLDPVSAPANEIFEMATAGGAKALGIDAGVIAEGKLADIVLIDLKRPELTPSNNLVANMVYSAKGSCVDTVICNGRILMQEGKVEKEEEIIEEANKAAEDLFGR